MCETLNLKDIWHLKNPDKKSSHGPRAYLVNNLDLTIFYAMKN